MTRQRCIYPLISDSSFKQLNTLINNSPNYLWDIWVLCWPFLKHVTSTDTHSLTHSHTHSHTHSITHSLTHTHTHSLTHSHTHSFTHSLTHSHTHSLSRSMVHSPSWEANLFSTSQEIPRTLWNQKIPYHIHKYPPPVRILSQINRVHATQSHFLNILVLSSHLRLGFPSGFFPSGFPTKTLYIPLPSPIRAICAPISISSVLSPE